MTKMFKAYDLPLRIFHWSFAFLFVFSFSIGKWVDDESALYAYHMLSGILMMFLIFLRLIWGIMGGGPTSRLSSWKLHFSDLKNYFMELRTDHSKRYLGHNPASSYAALLMFVFAFGIGFSGLMMVLRFNKHFFEELHELFAHGFLLVVIFHIVGVLFHHYRHRDGMILSMVNGKKKAIEGESDIPSNSVLAAFALVGMIAIMGIYLFRQYDSRSGQLAFFGQRLQLGEVHDKKERGRHHVEKKDRHEQYEEAEDDD